MHALYAPSHDGAVYVADVLVNSPDEREEVETYKLPSCIMPAVRDKAAHSAKNLIVSGLKCKWFSTPPSSQTAIIREFSYSIEHGKNGVLFVEQAHIPLFLKYNFQ